MSRARIERHEDRCGHCQSRRTREVDRRERRYHVTFPARCPDKDRCEREIMAGWAFVTDRDLRRDAINESGAISADAWGRLPPGLPLGSR